MWNMNEYASAWKLGGGAININTKLSDEKHKGVGFPVLRTMTPNPPGL